MPKQPLVPPIVKKVATHPATFFTLIAACMIFFIVSMILTYVPIFIVETQYQYKRVLNEVFHAKDLRSLILPTINTDKMGVKYTDFGMEIPELYLDEPIVFNVDPHDPNEYKEALTQGIAHAAGTELPTYPGLGYYFAHSSSPELANQYNAVFYLLGKLEKEDVVNIWYQENKYEYVVYDKQVVDPSDLSFLNKKFDVPTVVLQTCWPPGTTQKRLLIFAERKHQE